jgi:energy-coupling factor transporter ATP-binding protein EcfA2
MLPRSKSVPLKDHWNSEEETSSSSAHSAPTSPREAASHLSHRLFKKISKKKIALPLETETLHIGIYGTAKSGKTTLIRHLAGLPQTEMAQPPDATSHTVQSDHAFVYANSLTTKYPLQQTQVEMVLHEIYHLPHFNEGRKKSKIKLDALILLVGHDDPKIDNHQVQNMTKENAFEKELLSCIHYIKHHFECPIALAVNFSDTCLASMTRDDIHGLVADQTVIHADFISARTGDNLAVFFDRVLNITLASCLETTLTPQLDFPQTEKSLRINK